MSELPKGMSLEPEAPVLREPAPPRAYLVRDPDGTKWARWAQRATKYRRGFRWVRIVRRSIVVWIITSNDASWSVTASADFITTRDGRRHCARKLREVLARIRQVTP